MATIKHSSFLNLSEDGKLGFRLAESAPQFNWRNDPTLTPCRDSVLNAIQMYLTKLAKKELAPQIPMLAARLENQLFMDAFSKTDYMDQENFLDRLEKLIGRWWSSSQREPMYDTSSLPASAPTFGTSTDAGYNLLDRAPINRSAVGFCNAESGDSGVTCSEGVLQYDSEASFESRHYIYQKSAKGEANLVICSDQNSPSVHATAIEREKLKYEVYTDSDGLHLQQPVLGSPKHHLSHLESHCDGRFGEIKSLETLPVQNRNFYGSPGTTLTSSNTLQDSTERLLCCYFIYKSRSREGQEPFLERLHFLNCKNGVCSCERYKQLLSHYDNCGSAECSICGSAVRRISSVMGIMRPGLSKQINVNDRLTHVNHCGKRVFSNFSEDFMNPSKSRKLDTSPRRDSPSDVSALTEEPISPSGPLNFEQLPVSPAIPTIASPGAIVEITTNRTGNASRNSESDICHVRDVLGCKSSDTTIPSEGMSTDFRQVERVSSYINDSKRISQAGNGTLNDTRGSNSDDAIRFSDDLSADFYQKEIEPAVNELKDKVPDSRCESPSDSFCNSDDVIHFSDYQSADLCPNEIEPVVNELEDKVHDNHCEFPSDSVVNLCGDKSIARNVEWIPGSESSDPEEIQSRINQEEITPIAVSWTKIKPEKQKAEGISLIDFFTPEEIRQHMTSLGQKVEQDIAVEIVRNGASCSVSENSCQLCLLVNREFSPLPLFCSTCGGCIKNHATYYSGDETCDQVCLCTTCYNKIPRHNVVIPVLGIPKSDLKAKKNNVMTLESWVECDRCKGWQHQICALFNDRKNIEGKSEYLCPKCYLEDLETGGKMPLPRSSSMDASNLPQSLLSDHLEQRLFGRLKEERENRAKVAGKNPEEVPQPADLAIRVVSSVDKTLKVKQQFLDIFPKNSYPAEFPYRSKVILLFQRIEGVDVCLFAMYVQEFGSACSQPNQRCVYISYLDSVKYFRPDIKTVKGEALRTFVYHEILVGYLDYCKKRGFATCYIWACPPVKGEDYILYCHPETQKTPKSDKLRHWYQTMLKKAAEENIVVNFSNLYEKFFVPSEECKTKVTAARLPYFEGDYWSSVVESMIYKIDRESGGDPQKKVKKMRKRSLKAMGHTDPSSDEAKDILLMQALGQTISSAKDDFFIVYMQFVCTHCHEVILSGQRWFCNQCKNYQLCRRCHDVAMQSGLGDMHISSSGQRHALSQEMVNDVPIDTEDNDAIMGNCFLENRHALLSFCQGNHYQFDSLRRAKHSSMMILYHLHNPMGSDAGNFCSLCLEDTGADPRWICEICSGFSVCSSCYERRGASCHGHMLIRHVPTAIRETESKMEKLVKQLLDVLLHASRCETTTNNPCSYPNCMILRRLFSHARACKIRVDGGCCHCKKAWFILSMHSRRCKDPGCGIPRCLDLKNHAKRLELERGSRRFL